ADRSRSVDADLHAPGGGIMRGRRGRCAAAPSLTPLEQLPAVAGFVVRRVDGGILDVEAAAAFARHPPAHFGSEPDLFLALRRRMRKVGGTEVDLVDESKRSEPPGG